MPTPFHPQPRVGHPLHPALDFTPGCPECEMALCLLTIEHDLRDLSVDLWIAGWTPTGLIDHVRSEVADLRGADLVARGILYEDTTRADHARPSSWQREILQLRREFGVDRTELHAGWIIEWLFSNSEYDSAAEAVAVIEITMSAVSGLIRPMPGPTIDRTDRAR